MGFNIAIDGPAGAGKSTIAKLIAKKKGLIYVDTGAMYRAMAIYFIENGINQGDEKEVSAACQNADVSIKYVNGEQMVYLNGVNVTPSLRKEEVGAAASKTSAYPEVRRRLTLLQQKMAAECDVVMDGRDICTVVLPNADVKVFLTASSHIRAKRRYDELTSKGLTADFEQIEADIIKRDEQDMTRQTAPLKKADDAVEIDSSYMSIEEVAEKIISMCED